MENPTGYDSDEINEIIRDRVVNIFEKYDMWLDEDVYYSHMGTQISEGEEIWGGIEEEILQRNISEGREPFVTCLPRITIFGHTMGLFMHEWLSNENEFRGEIALNSAIFNVSISLFDMICDWEDEPLPDLKDSLINTFFESNKNMSFHFDGKTNQKLILEVFTKLFNEYIKRCKTFYNTGKRTIVWNEFVDTILKMYQAEVRSQDFKLSSRYEPDEIRTTLSNINSLPAWAIALNVLLTPDAPLVMDFRKIKNEVIEVGNLFWILDDLIDSIEDLEDDRWSYTWLALRESGVKIIDSHNNLRPKDELLKEFLESGIIEESTHYFCKKYKEIEVPRYRKDFLAWFQSWVNTIKN